MPDQDNNNRRRQRRQQPVDNTYGHLQPQAPDVEKAVLGALMIDHLDQRVSTSPVTKWFILPSET